MNLRKLKLYNFRNFKEAEFEFSKGINLITGLNGSGKTSILEAIFLIATGRSFRTSAPTKTISYQSDELAVFSEFINYIGEDQKTATTIGYKRHRQANSNTKLLKINEQKASSLSEVAKLLPVCCLEGNGFRALIDTPESRRRILDWGVFHVKHSFHSVWKKYNEVLVNRNKLLKNRAGLNSISSWDQLFADNAVKMVQIRQDYIEEVTPYFNKIIKSFDKIDDGILLRQNSGLHSLKTEDVIARLRESFNNDLERGFTSFGPHRADLVFVCKKGSAKDYLSRGQQKIILIAFILAQLQLLSEKYSKNCIVLIDDIAAELDDLVLNTLYSHLQSLDHQLLVTVINKKDIPEQLKNCSIICLE